MVDHREQEMRTDNALNATKLQRLRCLVSLRLLPDVFEAARECGNDVVAPRQVQVLDLVFVLVSSLLGLVRRRVDLLCGELEDHRRQTEWRPR